MQLLRESNRGIVVGQLARRARIGGCERDAVVDVEDAVAAAGRPDDGCGLDAVGLGVDFA